MKSRFAIDYIHIEEDGATWIFIDQIEDEFVMPADYAAHRHDFQELFWIKSGYGTHIIDGQLHQLAPLTLSLIAKGQVHKMDEAFGTNGCYIRFTDAFLHNIPNEEAWVYASLFNPATINNTLVISPQEALEVEQLLGLIAAEYQRESVFGKYLVLKQLLLALLIKIEGFNRLIVGSQTTVQLTSYQVYRDFFKLLEEHFRSQHDVFFYAQQLHVTPSQLSKLIQQKIGKSAKKVILERVLLEAKRYLHFTELSVKEIAATLGYSDPYHFSKVFKQAESFAPQTYREQWHSNHTSPVSPSIE